MLHDVMAWDRALPWLLMALGTGYAFGSVPFGLILARVFGLGDLRKVGSGNIGATNVLRTGSKAAAALTLLLDFAKGLIPVLIFLQWGDLAAQAAGVGAVLGHALPVWLWFRGGKALATFLGVLAALYWPAWIAVCATWLTAAALSRISSVGGLVSAASAPIWFLIFGRYEAVLAVGALAIWIWLRHHENIARLMHGTEPRIGAGKSPPQG